MEELIHVFFRRINISYHEVGFGKVIFGLNDPRFRHVFVQSEAFI